jgi:hypothetical protein
VNLERHAGPVIRREGNESGTSLPFNPLEVDDIVHVDEDRGNSSHMRCVLFERTAVAKV